MPGSHLAPLPTSCVTLVPRSPSQPQLPHQHRGHGGHSCRSRPLIKKKLSQGITLVVDRYAFSGVAFTSAKENFSLDWCKQPDVGLPKPDLVVFLQLRLAEAATRGEFGRERYENGNFQERALRRFHQLMADKTLNWKMVDASKSIEDVHKEIHALSVDTIRAVMQRPLGELWK
ncbi:thymidylate kinase isoform X2 [Panthera tigris]|uniref:thymidylate kinase isoform X2 n=1 Tax=Panthera tigris TaxID=9694 RepID=UPI0007662523|nr:thymidylate kinase isoform X2 [Panthera tigris]